MNLSQIAKELGRRGGKARAKRLSAERRREIALAGARARSESYEIARRMEANFRYVEAIREMRKAPNV